MPPHLNAPDADVVLDLGAAFAMTYDGGRYNQTLRYDLPLPHTLAVVDREWVESLVNRSAQGR